jgi:hypothetical protein
VIDEVDDIVSTELSINFINRLHLKSLQTNDVAPDFRNFVNQEISQEISAADWP